MNILELMYKAVSAERGVVILTNNPTKLKQRIYSERAKDRQENNGTSIFDSLKAVTSPTNPQGEIWLMNSKQTQGDADG